MSQERMHISINVMDKCEALMWSYGEICVGCNCCGRNKTGNHVKDWLNQLQARLRYAKDERKRLLHFDSWSKNKEQRELQKKNIKHDLKYYRKRITILSASVKKVKTKLWNLKNKGEKE